MLVCRVLFYTDWGGVVDFDHFCMNNVTVGSMFDQVVMNNNATGIIICYLYHLFGEHACCATLFTTSYDLIQTFVVYCICSGHDECNRIDSKIKSKSRRLKCTHYPSCFRF